MTVVGGNSYTTHWPGPKKLSPKKVMHLKFALKHFIIFNVTLQKLFFPVITEGRLIFKKGMWK